MKNLISIFTVFMFLASCAGTSSIGLKQKAGNHKQLGKQLETIFADSVFSNAFWGVYVKSLTTGNVVYKKHEKQLFMPASNTKIPTTAASLLELGPYFTFETILYTDGNIQDSVLNGNLYIKGTGDPTLYEQFYDSTTAVFYEWTKVLKEKGIHTINGAIIGDESAFSEKHLGDGWAFDNFGTWYSAEFGPLQLNENYIDIYIVAPKTKIESIQILPNISSSYYTIVNHLIVVDSGKIEVNINREFNSNTLTITGTVVLGSDTLSYSPSLSNPGMFYTTVLRETFLRNGIQVTGFSSVLHDTVASDSLQKKGFILHRHQSPKGLEILTKLMKRSQNLYAETMPRYLGYLRKGYGSFENGKEVVSEQLSKMGIPKDTYQYYDGSGLSRYNYFSPLQFATILEYMYSSPFKEEWLSTFPIAGVDGTLKSRMKDTFAEGNVRAKTGTISNVRGLSGYVISKSGEVFVFSFLVNAHLTSNAETNRITDTALVKLAEFDN